MAWSTITDSVLQVGAPIRALTLRLLRDNFAALANGDAGAPRIQNAALQDYLITANKIGGGQVQWWNLRAANEERDWVLGRLSALDAGAVGTLVFAERPSAGGTSISYGATYAGSALQAAGLFGSSTATHTASGVGLSGTWRALGFCATTFNRQATLFIRIA